MSKPTVTTLSGQVIAVDFLTRDFEGFTADALVLADTVAPDWTDRNELDVGVTIVEAMSFMSDNLSYYQDRVGGEALFLSAQQRRSIIEHSKLIGYELRPNISASVELTFVTNASGLVPAGTTVDVDTSDGSDPETFELDADFSPAGAGTFTGIIALAGQTVAETLGSSTGTAGQTFQLGQRPLALDPDGTSSLQVFVAEGGPPVQWTEVDNSLGFGPLDEIYRVEIDESDNVTVIFFDGVAGKIPASGTNNVTSIYRVGGGRSGNAIGPDKLTRLGGTFAFVDSVTNPLQPSGGLDKETIEQAKVNAPRTLAALDRAVTHRDYEALARRVPGVSKSFAANGLGKFEEVVSIASAGTNPVPTGTWDPFLEIGTGLLGAVGDFLTVRKTVPVILSIVPARAVGIILQFTATLFENARRSTARQLIQEAVEEAYNPESFELGATVPISLVSDIVEDINGVDYVTVELHQRQPSARAIDALGSDITFDTFIVGSTTLADRWTVKFTSATLFQVIRSNGDVDPTTGILGTTFTTADGGFSFNTNVETIAPQAGSTWELLTSTNISDIDMDRDEIGTLDPSFNFALSGGVA